MENLRNRIREIFWISIVTQTMLIINIYHYNHVEYVYDIILLYNQILI